MKSESMELIRATHANWVAERTFGAGHIATYSASARLDTARSCCQDLWLEDATVLVCENLPRILMLVGFLGLCVVGRLLR